MLTDFDSALPYYLRCTEIRGRAVPSARRAPELRRRLADSRHDHEHAIPAVTRIAKEGIGDVLRENLTVQREAPVRRSTDRRPLPQLVLSGDTCRRTVPFGAKGLAAPTSPRRLASPQQLRDPDGHTNREGADLRSPSGDLTVQPDDWIQNCRNRGLQDGRPCCQSCRVNRAVGAKGTGAATAECPTSDAACNSRPLRR